MTYREDFVEDYLRTALWAETVSLPCDESDIVDGCMDVNDEHPLYAVYECEPLDDYFDVSDFTEEARAKADADCEEFLTLLDKADLWERAEEYGDIAHNFWLTRNGHGAGFWDGDYGDIGDELTRIVKDNFSECNVLLNSDGTLDLT